MKKNKRNSVMKIISWAIVSCFVFLSCNSVIFAQAAPTPPATDPNAVQIKPFEVSKYLKIDQGQTYLQKDTTTDAKKGALVVFIIMLITLLTQIIGSFALVVIIAGGITLMISHGNQGLQTKGKEMIKFAILGLIIAFMSLIIVTFVQSLFFTA